MDEVTRVGPNPIGWCHREGNPHEDRDTRRAPCEDALGDGRDAGASQGSMPPWQAGGGQETFCAAFPREHGPAP